MRTDFRDRHERDAVMCIIGIFYVLVMVMILAAILNPTVGPYL